MQGLHLTADLHEVAPPAALRGCLTDPAALRALCVDAVAEAGLQAVGELFHRFDGEPGGVTGVVLLAESHVAVHTWPELQAVTLDVYVCNYGGDNRAAARLLLDRLVTAFRPGHAEFGELSRGEAPHRPRGPLT